MSELAIELHNMADEAEKVSRDLRAARGYFRDRIDNVDNLRVDKAIRELHLLSERLEAISRGESPVPVA